MADVPSTASRSQHLRECPIHLSLTHSVRHSVPNSPSQSPQQSRITKTYALRWKNSKKKTWHFLELQLLDHKLLSAIKSVHEIRWNQSGGTGSIGSSIFQYIGFLTSPIAYIIVTTSDFRYILILVRAVGHLQWVAHSVEVSAVVCVGGIVWVQ